MKRISTTEFTRNYWGIMRKVSVEGDSYMITYRGKDAGFLSPNFVELPRTRQEVTQHGWPPDESTDE